MSARRKPNFSQTVTLPESVQLAFEPHGVTRAWWKLILALHGKPQTFHLSENCEIDCIARGFQFYAMLYRSQSIPFLVLALLCVTFNLAENTAASLYWALASLFAALYLWCISGLGYAGATCYRIDQEKGRIALFAFMVAIIAFLSVFVAAVSVAVIFTALISPAPNIAAAAALFVFGIGSYMIEIVYLATTHSAVQVVKSS